MGGEPRVLWDAVAAVVPLRGPLRGAPPPLRGTWVGVIAMAMSRWPMWDRRSSNSTDFPVPADHGGASGTFLRGIPWLFTSFAEEEDGAVGQHGIRVKLAQAQLHWWTTDDGVKF